MYYTILLYYSHYTTLPCINVVLLVLQSLYYYIAHSILSNLYLGNIRKVLPPCLFKTQNNVAGLIH